MSDMNIGADAAASTPPPDGSQSDGYLYNGENADTRTYQDIQPDDNLFADDTAEATETIAAKGTEEGDEPAKATEPTQEEQEQRALFDKLKAQYEPDSPNFKAVRTKAEEYEGKYNTLKAFEPLATIPNLSENLPKLITGQVEGKEGLGIIESLTTPQAFESIREEAFWHYAGDERNGDAMARSIFGQHMDAETLWEVAKALDPKSGSWTKEELLEQLRDEAQDSALTPQQIEERNAWRAEQAATKADREAIAKEKERTAQETEMTARRTAAEEIYSFTDQPIDEIEKQFWPDNPKDPPEIKALKQEARENYRARVEKSLIASDEAKNHITNITALLGQGSGLKDRAMSMYAPSLQLHTRSQALQAARATNKFVKAHLMEIRAELGKTQTAPTEVGSLSATGGQAGSDMTRIERAQAAYNAHVNAQ